MFRTLLLSLLQIDGDGGKALAYGMSDDIVAKKLKMAINQNGNKYVAFNNALEQFRDVTDFRNKLVHWVPFTNPGRTTLEFFV